MGEKSTLIVRFMKNLSQNKFNNRKKFIIVFDRAMSNTYGNLFPTTVPCDLAEIDTVIR